MIRRVQSVGTAGVLLGGLFAYGAAALPGFTSRFSLDAMLVLASFLGVAAVGQTLTALVGGIDLSIPFVIGMANVALAQLSGQNWNSVAAIVFIVGLGAGVGLLNGVLSWWLGLHPLLVTLGVGFAVQGAVQIWTHGNVQGGAPQWVADLVSINKEALGFLPFPNVVVAWAVLAAGVVLVLRCTRWGRYVYAVGSSPLAADRALIDRRAVWISTFAVSGAFAAVAGILLGGFTGGGFVDIGSNYLFLTIAAVVVGGTSLLGGTGGYGPTIVGTLVLTVLTQILVGERLSTQMQQVVMGTLIVAMVSLYAREPHARTRV